MTAKKITLGAQIKSAQRSLQETAEVAPWLYPAYNHYKQAERELAMAQAKFDKAKAEWDQFRQGSD